LQSQLRTFVTGSELSAYGGEELKRAEDAVRRLSNEQMKTEELEVALYEARRLLEIAEFSARARIADTRRDALAAERERLVVMARTREAEEARAEVAAAQALKETALAEAKAAELAKAEAEAARLSAAEQQRVAEEAARAARAQAEAAKREVATAREEMESMRSRLAELEARPTERGLLLTLGDVLFAFNKADLKAGVARTLMPLANVLKEKPEQTVVVEGHTDSVGSREYNLQLSERRADSVRDFLVEQGVDPARISVEGLGPDFPIADNADEAGRQRNRRVEVILPNVEKQ
jgi:outer membrane protein OmpA-like peptidoglycan-associated protein